MHSSSAQSFAFRRRLGYDPRVTLEQMGRIAHAVMIIVGADGKVSETEWNHYVEIGRAYGVPEPMIAELKDFDYRNGRLEDYLAGLPPGAPTLVMLYDAIEVSSVDGYHEAERANVYKAAKLLGVDPGIVAALEGIVKVEEDLRVTKERLFSARY